MIADQIRLELLQQLEACENRIRSWVKESQASSAQQLSSILTEFTSSRIEQQEASKLHAPAKPMTPPDNLLAAQKSHSNHSCSPERPTLKGAWTPSRPPATLGTPGVTSCNRAHTPHVSRENQPLGADGCMAAGKSPVVMHPRVSPWAACNSACEFASPRTIRPLSVDGTPRTHHHVLGQFANSKSQVSLTSVSVQSQRPTARMTSPARVYRA